MFGRQLHRQMHGRRELHDRLFFCALASGICTPKGGAGATCTSGNQCTTAGGCVDGVCCAATCTLACQGCARATTGQADGTCAPRLQPKAGPTVPICAGACPPGYAICSGDTAGVCSRRTWTFEAPPDQINKLNPGEWIRATSATSAAIHSTIPVPAIRVHGGSVAARLRGNPPGDDPAFPLNWEAADGIELCPFGGSMDLRARTLTFFLFMDGPPAGSSQILRLPCEILGSTFDGTQFIHNLTLDFTPQFGTWFSVSQTFQSSASGVTHLSIDCFFDSWTGTAYMDDISIQ